MTNLELYRIARWLYLHKAPWLATGFVLVQRLLLGAHIPASVRIGKGCKLAYGGAGVVIHARAVIGDICVISPGVVIGGRSGHETVPTIGDGVTLYPGCMVLGPISVGDGAIVGPNAVLLKDLAPGEVYVAPLGRVIS